jgi:hypothetical protein
MEIKNMKLIITEKSIVTIIFAIIIIFVILYMGNYYLTNSFRTSYPTTTLNKTHIQTSSIYPTTILNNSTSADYLNRSLLVNYIKYSILPKFKMDFYLNKSILIENSSLFNNEVFEKFFYTGNSIETVISTTPFNYSSYNQSKLFVSYITIVIVNNSDIKNFTYLYKNGKGLIGLNSSEDFSNVSTFRYYNISIYNQSGYLDELSNFTQQGLNLTNSYYIGKKPNLSWYLESVLYKNTYVIVGMWGFGDNINITSLNNYTLEVVKDLKAAYS